MRILLVEDDPMLGNAITASLARHHYTADWVTSGESALHALKADDFLLIILDIGLPGISGLQVLKELRDKGDKTPVLILSARDELNDRVYGLNHGADDYLVKPFQLEELLARTPRRTTARPGLAHGQATPCNPEPCRQFRALTSGS